MSTPAKLTIKEAKALYLRAKEAYYNGEPIMKDPEFDKLEDRIRKKDPEWAELGKTGVRPDAKKKDVELRFLMPSLNKVYPEDVPKWQKKQKPGSYLVLDKEDGSSLQLVIEDGRPVGLYTRGDGQIGGDISYMIPYLNIPDVSGTHSMVLRLEALMKSAVFEKKYSIPVLGEKHGAKNARNLVNGVLNRSSKAIDRATLKDVNLVVLGVYDMGMKAGLDWAASVGFEVAHYTEVDQEKLTAEYLSKILEKRLLNSVYAMDGLVIVAANKRFAYESVDKPKWTVAFKKNTEVEDAHEVLVLDVIYEEAKSKKLTPVAQIEPTEIGGVTVRQVTMSNVQLMEERGVGPGARIKVVRSGDVIPFWLRTVKTAPCKYPDVPYRREGCWLYATEFSEGAEHQKILHFFTTCGIENIAIKSIEALYDCGLNTFMDYVRLTQELHDSSQKRHDDAVNFLEGTGIGKAKTKTLVKELGKLRNVPLKTMILATAVMPAGIGERKLNDIEAVTQLRALVGAKPRTIRAALHGISGFQDASIEKVVEGMTRFGPILEELVQHINIDLEPPKQAMALVPADGPYREYVATWTGYRDEQQEAAWAAGGGKIVSFGSKTTHLFYKEGGKKSTKIQKAQEKGITATTWADFIKEGSGL